MTPRRLYLALAILGLVLPNAVLLPWVAEHGFAPRLFVEQLFANGISTFFGLDVIVSGLVLIAFVVIEGRRLRIPNLWLPIAGLLLAGVSFALPLFLFLREGKLDESRANP